MSVIGILIIVVLILERRPLFIHFLLEVILERRPRPLFLQHLIGDDS